MTIDLVICSVCMLRCLNDYILTNYLYNNRDRSVDLIEEKNRDKQDT